MKFDRTGIILFVSKYVECVRFYKEIIGLEILFQKEELTCFDFHGTYLMVEQKSSQLDQRNQNTVCLRFNVVDFNQSCQELQSSGVEVKIEHYDWGSVGRFVDPEGNRCSLKDASSFNEQVLNG